MNLLSLLVSKVYATAGGSVPTTPMSGLALNSISGLVTAITNIIIIVGIALVVLFLALGFVKYITSQGDKNAVDSAQKTLTYAVIGGVGLLLVYGLRVLILQLLGASTTQFNNY